MDYEENASAEDRLLGDDLDEWMAGGFEPEPALDEDGGDPMEVAAGLELRADWALRKIARARKELVRIERHAAVYRERIDGWQRDRSAGPTRLIAEEAQALEAITRRLAELDPKRRSVALPAGKVKLTKPGAARLVVDDETAALAWLEKNAPEAVRRPEPPAPSVDKPALKRLAVAAPMSSDETDGTDPDTVLAHATIAGEIIPGVHYENDAKDRFGYEC